MKHPTPTNLRTLAFGLFENGDDKAAEILNATANDMEAMQSRIRELEAERNKMAMQLAGEVVRSASLRGKMLDYESALDAIAKHSEVYGATECARIARRALEGE
jgi:N-acetylglucosamine kinase-like BadF-type ATPase